MPVEGTAGRGDLFIRIEVEVLAAERKLLATNAQEALLPLFGDSRRQADAGSTDDVKRGLVLTAV
jgi:hypothetical protein